MPRRIAAITISDRVATERGERVGHTVGYQIRLESCISPTDTLLTYCTSGILLRSLTSFDYSILKNTTHIIIDEVHERDRQTEFLLACLRDVGPQFPNLKLILMGADMDTQLMTSYFGGSSKCPLIEVHGRLYPVQTLYLEDALTMLHEESAAAGHNNQYYQQQQGGRRKNTVMNNLVQTLNHPNQNQNPSEMMKNLSVADFEQPTNSIESTCSKVQDIHISNELKQELNSKIVQMWRYGRDSVLDEYLDLINTLQVSVDYQHNDTSATMLMACAVQGRVACVLTLLSNGADPKLTMSLSDGRNYSAKDWAIDHEKFDIVQALEQHEYGQTLVMSPETSRYLPVDVKERLERYQSVHTDDRVDLQLIVDILYQIHTLHDPNEAVLVFLPGYEEIVTLKQMIFTDQNLGNLSNDLIVFLLHSNIQSGDQRLVFETPSRGRRKIVLSTNIAETSLTIEDVVYVIDSGKVKEKSFDSMTGVTQLKATWISKASANQRQGRAGRCRSGTYTIVDYYEE